MAWHWARVLYRGKGSEDGQVMQGCLYAKRREVKKEGNNKGCTSCTSCVSNKWLMLFAGYFNNCFSFCFVVCLSLSFFSFCFVICFSVYLSDCPWSGCCTVVVSG